MYITHINNLQEEINNKNFSKLDKNSSKYYLFISNLFVKSCKKGYLPIVKEIIDTKIIDTRFYIKALYETARVNQEHTLQYLLTLDLVKQLNITRHSTREISLSNLEHVLLSFMFSKNQENKKQTHEWTDKNTNAFYLLLNNLSIEQKLKFTHFSFTNSGNLNSSHSFITEQSFDILSQYILKSENNDLNKYSEQLNKTQQTLQSIKFPNNYGIKKSTELIIKITSKLIKNQVDENIPLSDTKSIRVKI